MCKAATPLRRMVVSSLTSEIAWQVSRAHRLATFEAGEGGVEMMEGSRDRLMWEIK